MNKQHHQLRQIQAAAKTLLPPQHSDFVHGVKRRLGHNLFNEAVHGHYGPDGDPLTLSTLFNPSLPQRVVERRKERPNLAHGINDDLGLADSRATAVETSRGWR